MATIRTSIPELILVKYYEIHLHRILTQRFAYSKELRHFGRDRMNNPLALNANITEIDGLKYLPNTSENNVLESLFVSRKSIECK